MLSSEQSDSTQEHHIIVQPNASLNQRSACLFFAGISTVSLLIAIRFMLLGAWLVLPFVMLELMALAFCLHLVLKSNRRSESIHITDEQVTLIQRNQDEEKCLNFHRYWVQLVAEKSTKGKNISQWHPMRLLLRSHGRSVEIGSFINHEEKQELEQQLRLALLQRA